MAEILIDEKTERKRPTNRTYDWLKACMANQTQSYKAWWARADAGSKAAMNRGVRCYMRKRDIFSGSGLKAAIEAAALPDPDTGEYLDVPVWATNESVATAVDCPHPEDTLFAVYSPQSNPMSVIAGGIPRDLTDLALRSSLIWKLRSPALKLGESGKMCSLFATTAFYLPNISVRHAPFSEQFRSLQSPFSINVCLMSTVNAVRKYWLGEGRRDCDINMSNLVYDKLVTPLYVALDQNRKRANLRPPLPPIRHVVIGDLGISADEEGMNSLLAYRVAAVRRQFAGCFDSITVCCSDYSTYMQLSILSQLQPASEPSQPVPGARLPVSTKDEWQWRRVDRTEAGVAGGQESWRVDHRAGGQPASQPDGPVSAGTDRPDQERA